MERLWFWESDHRHKASATACSQTLAPSHGIAYRSSLPEVFHTGVTPSAASGCSLQPPFWDPGNWMTENSLCLPTLLARMSDATVRSVAVFQETHHLFRFAQPVLVGCLSCRLLGMYRLKTQLALWSNHALDCAVFPCFSSKAVKCTHATDWDSSLCARPGVGSSVVHSTSSLEHRHNVWIRMWDYCTSVLRQHHTHPMVLVKD